jgi:hypothetical protein
MGVFTRGSACKTKCAATGIVLALFAKGGIGSVITAAVDTEYSTPIARAAQGWRRWAGVERKRLLAA